MKRIIFAGLIAFVGVVSVQSGAHAASRCNGNVTTPDCQNYNNGNPPPPFPPPQGGGNPPPPPPFDPNHPHKPHHGMGGNGGIDNGPGFGGFRHRYNGGDFGLFFNFNVDPGYNDLGYVDRCDAIARSLRRSGFRSIREISCSGRTYQFFAKRDGERLRIWVNSRSGRIINIKSLDY